LVTDGQITTDNRNGMFSLILTHQGFEDIYPINIESTKKKIGDMILNGFAKQNSKPNHVLDQRWINFSLADKLNPREVELLDDSIEDLKTKAFITTDNRNGMFCLVLTEKGFNHIY